MNNKVCVPRQTHGVPMIFDRFFEEMNGVERLARPAVNILEGEQGYWLELVIPGVPKDEVKIELEDTHLLVSYDASKQRVEEGYRFRRKEFAVRSFTRKFAIPEHIDREQIKAQFEHGVLRIHLPKLKQAAQEKRQIIPIQ